jgi:hypothetical protein
MYLLGLRQALGILSRPDGTEKGDSWARIHQSTVSRNGPLMRPSPTITQESALKADQRLANPSRNQSLTIVPHVGNWRDSRGRLIDCVNRVHSRNQALGALSALRSDSTDALFGAWPSVKLSLFGSSGLSRECRGDLNLRPHGPDSGARLSVRVLSEIPFKTPTKPRKM